MKADKSTVIVETSDEQEATVNTKGIAISRSKGPGEMNRKFNDNNESGTRTIVLVTNEKCFGSG